MILFGLGTWFLEQCLGYTAYTGQPWNKPLVTLALCKQNQAIGNTEQKQQHKGNKYAIA